jgi:hypothetical protein
VHVGRRPASPSFVATASKAGIVPIEVGLDHQGVAVVT